MSTTTTLTEKREEKRLYRFDELCVDPVRRVLLRDGEPVPITPKALAILLVLLENRGEVVTKEELIRQVWAGARVSDANLAQNVLFLRKALGDRTGDRRYVVTIPGHGYCFASPVTEEAGEASGSFPAVPAREEASAPPPAAPSRAWDRRSLVRIGLGLVSVAVLVVLSLYLARLSRGPLALPEDLGSFAPSRRPSVAVLGFRSLARDGEGPSGEGPSKGRGWLSTALAEMLTTELAAGTRVRVISRETVARAAHPILEIPESGTLDPATLARLHSIVGSDLLVMGTYLILEQGGERRLRLDVRVLELPGGDIAASFAEVRKEPELFELVSRTGAYLREILGFTELSPEQARAARALQPSDPEAVQLYAAGLERLRASDAPRALELLQRAVRVEPRSPVIHSALSQAFGLLGYDARAAHEAKRAVELAGGLPQEQRLGIEARLYELTRQWSRASETYRSLWTFFPDDLDYGLQLATSLMIGGRTADALETVAALHRLPPPEGEDPRIDLLEARIARRLSDPRRELRAAQVAMAKGRRSGATLIVAQGLIFAGDALSGLGSVDQALDLFREAKRLAEQDDHPMVLGMALANLGIALQKQGDLDEAESIQREALAIAERIGSAVGIAAQLYILGVLHREQGETAEALSYLERARALNVELGDRTMEARTLTAIGQALSEQGEPAAARRSFERAVEISRDTGDRANEVAALRHLERIERRP